MTFPFIAYDCCRCRNEVCQDKNVCLRYLNRENSGPRTGFVMWESNPPVNGRECDLAWLWKPDDVELQSKCRGDKL